jgi:hypothetical protein
MTALRDLHPDRWDAKNANHLLLSESAMRRFFRGETAGEIVGGWTASVMEFERRRSAFLLY